MYRLEREEFVRYPYVALWALLAFQAGFLNAIGFLTCGRYVSHVTGVGTQVGVALGEQDGWFALELLGFPFFFILGAFLSGFFISARIERRLRPHYGFVTFLLPVAILILMLGGAHGYFGPFGEQLIRARDFVLLYSLSFVCGLQNGCFAALTRGQIRTTHLTGISTDIGTDFARLWFGGLEGAERRLTRKVNVSRIATFFSFAVGSVGAVHLGGAWGYWSLVVPLLTALMAWFVIQAISHTLDLRSRSADQPPASQILAKYSEHGPQNHPA